MSLSGFVGSNMTEEAERTRKLNSLEKSTLIELKNSISKASRFASLWAAIIGGLSPAFAPILCLILSFYHFKVYYHARTKIDGLIASPIKAQTSLKS